MGARWSARGSRFENAVVLAVDLVSVTQRIGALRVAAQVSYSMQSQHTHLPVSASSRPAA